MWCCTTCTFENGPMVLQCEVCLSIRIPEGEGEGDGKGKKRPLEVITIDDDDDGDSNNSDVPAHLLTQLRKHAKSMPFSTSSASASASAYKNVINLLSTELTHLHAAEELFDPSPRRFFRLCAPSLRLYKQSTKWSCGYENFRMVLSSILLSPSPHPLKSSLNILTGRGDEKLPEGFDEPSIISLQKMIKIGWVNGFDLQGSVHFGGEIVGSKRWTGALEFAHVINMLGLISRTREFRVEKVTPNQSFAGSRTNIVVELMKFVWGYFEGGSDGGAALPLYFQYPGHSLTIVGVESNTPTLTNRSSSKTPPKPSTNKSCPCSKPLTPQSNPNAVCDACERNIPFKEHYSGCRKCDFDVCRSCFSKPEFSIGSLWTAGTFDDVFPVDRSAVDGRYLLILDPASSKQFRVNGDSIDIDVPSIRYDYGRLKSLILKGKGDERGSCQVLEIPGRGRVRQKTEYERGKSAEGETIVVTNTSRPI
ncbi:hypothetical protein TrST_g1009 [Triparma strigata]|uniref:RanBP2-type domain-containing protein n=1 Tax=Triparma strigata TaxID=1606541 RepID=A0A9W6ZQ35_9STRA|nr:hypothetical protein TrST_g1009 [Triparma strigata]